MASGNFVFGSTQTEMAMTSLFLELLWDHCPVFVPSEFIWPMTDLHETGAYPKKEERQLTA